MSNAPQGSRKSKWAALRSLWGAKGEQSASASSSSKLADGQIVEEERFLSLLEALQEPPTPKAMRELMSASYRAGRHGECGAILSLYTHLGFEQTPFTLRTAELLAKQGAADLSKIMSAIIPAAARFGSGVPAPSPLKQGFAELSPVANIAFVADLILCGDRVAPSRPPTSHNLESKKLGRGQWRFEAPKAPSLFVFRAALADDTAAVEGKVIFETRRQNHRLWERHDLTRSITDPASWVCALSGDIQKPFEVRAIADDVRDVAIECVAIDDASQFIRDAEEIYATPALDQYLNEIAKRLDDKNSDSDRVIEDELDFIRSQHSSVRMQALLVAGWIARNQPSGHHEKWDARVSEWLISIEDQGDFAYQVASALFYGRRKLRTTSAIASRVLGTTNVPSTRLRRLEEFAGRSILLDRKPLFPSNAGAAFEPNPNSVLYCLHQALPHDTNGYVVRSHAILKALAPSDWKVEGLTRAGYGSGDKTVFDNITYYHAKGPNLSLISDWQYIIAAADEIHRLVLERRPAIVHAASSYANAWPALIAARRSGLPFVFEVRGFWEMSLGAKEPWAAESEVVELIRNNDTAIAKEADAVLVLTRAMKNELIARGVSAEKISIAPNAVDTTEFSTDQADRSRLEALGLDPKVPTIGYVGSVVGYEGLELLVEALGSIADDYQFNLLIVGDGSAMASVAEAVERHGLTDRTKLTGRVPRDEANDLYRLIDICPFPRLPLPVSENVSPLKPFEAMAQAKAVIASDVAAMREFIAEGQNGRLFRKGDYKSLATVLQSVIEAPEEVHALGERARSWVAENRNWHSTAAVITEVYSSVRKIETTSVSTTASPDNYRIIAESRRLAEFSLERTAWVTISGRAAPMRAGDTAARIVFEIRRANGAKVFSSQYDASSSGLRTKDRGSADTSVAQIPSDGSFRVRFRLPASDEPYHVNWAGEQSQMFVVDTDAKVEIDQPVDLRPIDRKLKVALIADEFTTAAISGAADCVSLSRKNFLEELETGHFDLFLCESAWEGNGGQWRRGIGYYSQEEAADLQYVIDTCRKAGIPTVFFNKEDPVHFHRFKKTAARFDHVVTTDAGVIPDYLQLPWSRIKTVSARPFFANPTVHHPFGDREREDDFAYAGTYYGDRYQERTAQLDPMLKAAAKTNKLVIYDRYANVEDTPYRLPEEFKEYSRGGLDYSAMLDAYRRHGTFLNVNSVPDSETMFSRRIVESLASGAAIVTAPSRAVSRQLHGRVPEVSNERDAEALFSRIATQAKLRRHFAVSGMRVVLRELTAEAWLADVARDAGIDIASQVSTPTYAVDVPADSVRDSSDFLALIDMLATQSYRPSAIRIVGDLHDTLDRETKEKAIRLARLSQVPLILSGEGSDAYLGAQYTVEIEPGRWFGSTFFEDLLLLSKYAEADRLIAVPADWDGPTSYSRGPIEASTSSVVAVKREPSGVADIVGPSIALSEKKPRADNRTLLVAGHDLKFLHPFMSRFEAAGFRVLVDEWKGHAVHDAVTSEKLLAQADIVFCEWMLGNAEWYSRRISPDQALVGRLHLQEIKTEYPTRIDVQRFDRIFHVGEPTLESAIKKFGWERSGRDVVLGNGIDMDALDQPKSLDARFAVGFVGMVPQRKRIDRALNVLARLRLSDPRFHLRVKGKKPSDYPWLTDRPEEKAFYDAMWERVKNDPLLRGAVHFDGFGADMPNWFSKIGFALSCSDFESFHLTVADGAASRAVPIILPWEGADAIYPKGWIFENEKSAAHHILSTAADEEGWLQAGQEAREVINDRYSLDAMAHRMIRQILQVPMP